MGLVEHRGDLLDVDDPAQVAEAGHMLAALHDAMAAYPDRIGDGPSNRGQQLVHNDFRSANVLHEGASITAILDYGYQFVMSGFADGASSIAHRGHRYPPRPHNKVGPGLDEFER